MPKPKTQNLKPKSGFTLVELLITITIVIVIAAIGSMNLLGYTQRQNLNFTAQEIISVLRNAQNSSISQEGSLRWGVDFENPASGSDFYDLFKGATYADGAVVARNTLHSSVQFDIPATGATSTIIFAPATGLPNASTTIKISLIGNPDVSSTIMINSNGEISF